MEQNSYYIQLRGKANIPTPLQLGGGYKVSLEGEVTSESHINNQNGEYDTVFHFKPALCEIEDDKGIITKARDMRKRSEQLRRMVKGMWELDHDASPDHQAHYDSFMAWLLKNFYQLYDQYQREKKEN